MPTFFQIYAYSYIMLYMYIEKEPVKNLPKE